MRMLAYKVDDFEKKIFTDYCKKNDIELTMVKESPSLGHIALAEGMDCINVLSDTVISRELWDAYREAGITVAVTRCVGMEHMNQSYAEKIGIKVFNIHYSPTSVADYTIMMMMMTSRNIKTSLLRYAGQDYSQEGLMGRNISEMKIGIIGAGPIGCTVAKHLSGIGCKCFYWNRKPKKEMDQYAKYCELQLLLKKSDIVSIHIAANDETYHFMNKEKFELMKKNAIFINTARGTLVDSDALIVALEQKKISAAGLDVFDGDRSIYYKDHKNRIIGNHNMAVLSSMPNVLMLPHLAYYTERSLKDMVVNSLKVTLDYWKQKNLQRR